MFYQEDQINEKLICNECKKHLVDPKVLPCKLK
jgi:hypothetical protein